MPWFRLDDSFDTHPKVIAAGNEAVGLFVRCGTYCARHLTDGFIPEDVALLYGAPELVETLVRTKLWRRTRGGYRMRDYLAYNPSAQTVDKERAQKAERQKRWREGQRRRQGDASTYTSSDASQDGAPTPSRPAPKEAGRDRTRPEAVGAARASLPGPPGTNGQPKPSWCGICDEHTRHIGEPPMRCPNCHPLATAPRGRHTLKDYAS
jgi:hypothetical protein